MVILDTNVISELMKMKPDQAVFDWVGKAPAGNVIVAVRLHEDGELDLAIA